MIALLYLLDRPDVDVRAVAVSGTGLARCPQGARHARDLLALAGRVAVGADRPRFERDLLATLLAGARFGIPATRQPPALEFDGRSVTYRGPTAGTPGEAAFDTLNTSDRPFTFVVGRLSEGRTARELRGGPGAFRSPGWVFPELTGETPPHSRISWLKSLTPGEKAIVVTSTEPDGAWVVSPLSLR